MSFRNVQRKTQLWRHHAYEEKILFSPHSDSSTNTWKCFVIHWLLCRVFLLAVWSALIWGRVVRWVIQSLKKPMKMVHTNQSSRRSRLFQHRRRETHETVFEYSDAAAWAHTLQLLMIRSRSKGKPAFETHPSHSSTRNLSPLTLFFCLFFIWKRRINVWAWNARVRALRTNQGASSMKSVTLSHPREEAWSLFFF